MLCHPTCITCSCLRPPSKSLILIRARHNLESVLFSSQQDQSLPAPSLCILLVHLGSASVTNQQPKQGSVGTERKPRQWYWNGWFMRRVAGFGTHWCHSQRYLWISESFRFVQLTVYRQDVTDTLNAKRAKEDRTPNSIL